jgi:hypothetical protein
MKKLSTIKFNNFLGSTTLILVLSPFEVICKNLNFKFEKFKRNFPDDFKLKHYQLQSFITF